MGLFANPTPRYVPLPDKPEDPPKYTDPAVEAAAARTRQDLMSRAGYASGIKTGGQGLTTAAIVNNKTLLGA